MPAALECGGAEAAFLVDARRLTERFGFDRRTGLAVAGAAAFTVLFAWLPPGGLGIWVLKVLGLLLFGVGGIWFLYMVARGGLGFRADREGVTLGNPRIRQPGMHNRPLRVPWPDVAEVVLFHQYAGQARVPYLGLRLRPGVRRPNTTTFNRRSRLWPLNRGLFPGIPVDARLISLGCLCILITGSTGEERRGGGGCVRAWRRGPGRQRASRPLPGAHPCPGASAADGFRDPRRAPR